MVKKLTIKNYVSNVIVNLIVLSYTNYQIWEVTTQQQKFWLPIETIML